MRRSTRALAVALALVAALLAGAAGATGHAEQEAREIAKLLRCPVCQNLSVADSQSQLAEQMRGVVRGQVEAGLPRAEILAYFVDRYGEEVLLEPRWEGFAQLVWWGAAAIPLLGAALLALAARAWLRRRPPPEEPAPPAADLAAYESLLEHELERPERRAAW